MNWARLGRIVFASLGLALLPATQIAAKPKLAGTELDGKGFETIFNGSSLAGWEGDPRVWSVKDGVINAQTTHPIDHNTYLIFGKRYADFEIRLKYRFLSAQGNSGLQFRSGRVDGDYALAGPQANIVPVPNLNCGRPTCGQERFGMLSEELNRAELVLLGQKAVITRRQMTIGGTGQIVRTVLGTTNPESRLLGSVRPAPEWNEVVVIAVGPRIVYVLNGLLLFDATDRDPLAMREGLVGFQAHALGAESFQFQFKDIAIKRLTQMPDIAKRYKSQPTAEQEPVRTYRDIRMTDGKLYVPPVASSDPAAPRK